MGNPTVSDLLDTYPGAASIIDRLDLREEKGETMTDYLVARTVIDTLLKEKENIEVNAVEIKIAVEQGTIYEENSKKWPPIETE